MTISTPVNEYDAILGTLQHYVDGAKSGSSAEIKLAFHDQATIFGYVGPDLFAGAIQGFYEWHDSNGAAAEMQLRIVSVDVAGTVATVRIEIDNWTGHQFTDFMTLLKVDGEWKIMNKVFHLHG
jgi:hypothetical protein